MCTSKAHRNWSGQGESIPDPLAPEATPYQAELCPEFVKPQETADNKEVVVMVGVEPIVFGLSSRRSTIELHDRLRSSLIVDTGRDGEI